METTSNTKIHIQFGLVLAALSIMLFLLIYYRTLWDTKWINFIEPGVFMIGIFISVITYGKIMNHNVTFGNLFATGFRTTAVVAAIFSIFFIIFVLAFPEYKTSMLILQRKALENQHNLTNDQINNRMISYNKTFLVSYIGYFLFHYAILGVIASLIGAAIAKKQPKELLTYQEEQL